MASGDVANAFYCIEPPEQMAKWFTLDAVTAGEVSLSSLDGVGIPSDTLLTPYLCVLPMGFSWSLHFCQLALENAISKVKHTGLQKISDKCMPVCLTKVDDVAAAAYVDNYAG